RPLAEGRGDDPAGAGADAVRRGVAGGGVAVEPGRSRGDRDTSAATAGQGVVATDTAARMGGGRREGGKQCSHAYQRWRRGCFFADRAVHDSRSGTQERTLTLFHR